MAEAAAAGGADRPGAASAGAERTPESGPRAALRIGQRLVSTLPRWWPLEKRGGLPRQPWGQVRASTLPRASRVASPPLLSVSWCLEWGSPLYMLHHSGNPLGLCSISLLLPARWLRGTTLHHVPV